MRGTPPSASAPGGAPTPGHPAQAPPKPPAAGDGDGGCEIIDMPSYFPGLSNSQQKALMALIDGKSAIHAARPPPTAVRLKVAMPKLVPSRQMPSEVRENLMSRYLDNNEAAKALVAQTTGKGEAK